MTIPAVSGGVRRLSVAVLLPCVVLLAGCTKEKAEALALAAREFDRESAAAIDAYQNFLRRMRPEFALTPEEFTAAYVGLSGTDAADINAEVIDGLLATLSPVTTAGTQQLDDEFKRVRTAYQQFSAVLTQVTAGRMFSRQPVKDSEALAAKLVEQLIRFHEHTFTLAAIDADARATLQRELREILREPDETTRQARLQVHAAAIVAHHRDAQTQQVALQARFAQAVTAGAAVLKLIRAYDKLSTLEILNEIDHSLALAATLTGRTDLAGLGQQFTALKQELASDPYYTDLLARPVLDLQRQP